MQKVRYFVTLNPKQDAWKPSSQGSGNTAEEEAERVEEPEGMLGTKEARAFKSTGLPHMNSPRLRQHARGLMGLYQTGF